MSPLHIIEFTLGRLARRRWAGSTHAAINDTAVALVPGICAVVIGKGIRGASIHEVRISITLYRDNVLGEGSAQKNFLGLPICSDKEANWAGEFILARREESLSWTVWNVLFRIVADAGDYLRACNAIMPEC